MSKHELQVKQLIEAYGEDRLLVLPVAPGTVVYSVEAVNPETIYRKHLRYRIVAFRFKKEMLNLEVGENVFLSFDDAEKKMLQLLEENRKDDVGY